MFKLMGKNKHDKFGLSHDINIIKNAFQEVADDLKGKTTKALSKSFQEKFPNMKYNLVKTTAKKRFKIAGVALLVGMAVGYLLRR